MYIHTSRWTSLGLSLIEAMQIGMPVIALDATEASRAVPPAAGFISCDPRELAAAARHFLDDEDAAKTAGTEARKYALERYGLDRFLRDWDELLARFV